MSEPQQIKDTLIAHAHARGFDVAGVTKPGAVPEAKARLERFLADGAHGDMTWLATTADRRASPDALWPEVRSVIMLGMNYGPDEDPLAILKRKDRAAISTYAKGDDYHELIKSRLKDVARWLVANAGGDVKVFVDTAAVMEKPLAAAAGLGWQGKHTNLVSRQFGSWLFLGSIFTTLDLPADEAEPDNCGTCRACLDICPTAAFPQPYRLDARRCISYLTIEHKGHIPAELRTLASVMREFPDIAMESGIEQAPGALSWANTGVPAAIRASRVTTCFCIGEIYIGRDAEVLHVPLSRISTGGGY